MDKISPIKERILKYIEFKGITRTDFCEKTGISYANLKGRSLQSEIGGSQIGEILSTFNDISAEWLLIGSGKMLKSEHKECPLCIEKSKEIESLKEEIETLGFHFDTIINSKPKDNSNELNMIRDLVAENTLLKRENEELKKKGQQCGTYGHVGAKH